MCGLAGVIFKDKTRTEEQYAEIGNLFTGLLEKSEVRGDHATGCATIERQGAYRLIKAPMKATEFITDTGYQEHVSKLSDSSCAIIGHTRYTTTGSTAFNRNNHPIVAGNIVGTHNGHIRNHKELFREFDMNRFANVDSEVIFRLFHTADSPDDFFMNRFPKLEGRVSTVFTDFTDPRFVYVVKGNNPLSVYYDREYGCLWYGSTEEILEPIKKARKLKKVSLKKMTMLRVNTKTLKVLRKEVKFVARKMKAVNDSGATLFTRFHNPVNLNGTHHDGMSPATRSLFNASDVTTNNGNATRKTPKKGFKRTVQNNLYSGLLTVVCHSCGVSADVRTTAIFKTDYCKCGRGDTVHA